MSTPEADPETIELFVEESVEALGRCEQHLLAAERAIPPPPVIAALFRDVHTIKGTSGFLGFERVLSLSHVAEDLLARLRDQTLAPRPELFVLLMEVVDLLRAMLASIRAGAGEGPRDVAPLVARLHAALEGGAAASAAPPATAPPPAAPAPDAAPEATRDAQDGTVRVNVAVLDRLMNLMGELVLARNQMVQLARTTRDGGSTTQAACQRLSHVTSDLQEQIMKTRMQPVARVFEKIPRMVRDLCVATGKQVEARIDGNATEIDKALVEAVRDPVLHIVRNAVDHGIEPPEARVRAGKPAAGQVSVRASHEGGLVSIEISDDGKGIDPRALRAAAVKRGLMGAAEAERLSDREALDLIFRPGFSTAPQVTAISGRGVGMDVVRTHVDRAGGQVELESVVGKGTTIRLKMPLTLAIIPALLVRAGGQRFAIPQVSLLELVYLDEAQARTAIEHVRSAPVLRLRGELLPLVRLDRVLRLDGARPAEGVSIVVVAVGGRRCGLVVEQIHDTEEIVVKPLHGGLRRLACYSGATVLGDGGVALILDVPGLAGMSGIDLTVQARPQAAAGEVARATQQLLVLRAGDGQQCAVPLGLVARLERVPRASIERLAGAEVVQYRGQLLPLLRPEAALPLGLAPVTEDQAVVVFDFGQQVGMAVDEILDVVEAEVTPEAAIGAPPFTLGAVVLFGRSTLVLDVYALTRKLAPSFVQERPRVDRSRRRVLLVDDSGAMRTAVASYLRVHGLEVQEAPSGEVALRELAGRAGRFDAVVTDLEMPGADGFEVIRAARGQGPGLPVIAWTFHDDPAVSARATGAGATACIHKLQREALLATLSGVARRAEAA